MPQLVFTRGFTTSVALPGTYVGRRFDYSDGALEFGSEDPADASVTTRVVTILLPEDY